MPSFFLIHLYFVIHTHIDDAYYVFYFVPVPSTPGAFFQVYCYTILILAINFYLVHHNNVLSICHPSSTLTCVTFNHTSHLHISQYIQQSLIYCSIMLLLENKLECYHKLSQNLHFCPASHYSLFFEPHLYIILISSLTFTIDCPSQLTIIKIHKCFMVIFAYLPCHSPLTLLGALPIHVEFLVSTLASVHLLGHVNIKDSFDSSTLLYLLHFVAPL